LEQQSAAAKAAREKADAAQAAAEQAKVEKEAAERALVKVSPAEVEAKTAAEKELRQRTVAAAKAAESAAYNKAIAERERDKEAAAQEALEKRAAALNNALAKLAEAEALALGGLKPLPLDAWDHAKARHLLARAGFGGTAEEVAQLHAMGVHRAVEFLVDYAEQPILALPFDVRLAERPRPEDRLRDAKAQTDVRISRAMLEEEQIRRLRAWWFERMIRSQRPLQEKLTLFWHGHFATEYRTVRSSYAMYRQNELFREHAAGNFGSLLHGIAHDPAMLRYLDNNSNVQGHPNENLAREIMELFSMGEGQGYSEQDIMEAARTLTGYTFDPETLQFRFIAARHDAGIKTIFGESGEWAGDDLVELILKRPETARFIAGRLFRYFAYENPDPATVDSLASELRGRDGDLAPMLKNLFRSAEFYSPQSICTQIKSPVQLAVGLFRELGVKDVDWAMLESSTRDMGQDLFDPPSVKGWVGGRQWINANTLTTRQNVLVELVQPAPTRDKRDRGIDIVGLLQGKGCQSPADVVDSLIRCLFAVPLAPEKREKLVAFLADLPPAQEWDDRREQVNKKLRTLLVLMLTLPEYQMT